MAFRYLVVPVPCTPKVVQDLQLSKWEFVGQQDMAIGDGKVALPLVFRQSHEVEQENVPVLPPLVSFPTEGGPVAADADAPTDGGTTLTEQESSDPLAVTSPGTLLSDPPTTPV